MTYKLQLPWQNELHSKLIIVTFYYKILQQFILKKN